MLQVHKLIETVRSPEILTKFTAREWEILLPLGRNVGISGRWYDQIENLGLLDRIPPRVINHLWSDRLISQESNRRVLWEIDRVRHALRDLDVDFVLLKGGAYKMLNLAPGLQRLVSDLDILVSEDHLGAVENALTANGWRTKADDDYDEFYYRNWMHELPPMRHTVRGSWLDVHHNILPRTSRLTPNASFLLQRVQPIGDTGYYSLCSPDIVIHSILHGFHGGEFLNGFRDVLDVHELLTDFAAREPSFWSEFVDRVKTMNVERPTFYALRAAMLYFDSSVPTRILVELSDGTPNPLTKSIMDFAVKRSVVRQLRPNAGQYLAGKMLLVRSHWLKMPAWMLVKHLTRKFVKRRKLASQSSS